MKRQRPVGKVAGVLLRVSVCVLFLAAQSIASPPALKSFRLNGIDYVRLEDWSRVRGTELKWITPRKEARLGNLGLSIDSRRVTIDGVTVWLSFPVALRNGDVCVSALDLETAIRPVFSPLKLPKGKTIRTICIDPGHGGRDPGNREGKQQEKAYTLLLAKELRAQLVKAGYKVIVTRSFDRFVELDDRPRYAKKSGADLLLSLHFNSADGPSGASVQGVEVYCMTPAGAASTNARGEGATGAWPGNLSDSRNMLLAFELQKTLTRNLANEDRGVKRARFAVLRSAAMPAALIEGGFMTNPSESRKIYDPNCRRQMAAAIVEAVNSFKRSVE